MAVTLHDFLETHADQLAAALDAKLAPLYSPNDARLERYGARLTTLKRELYPVQAEIVKGLALALYEEARNRVFVCGEMGTGKTTMALATVAMALRSARTLVVCPTHLVEKWIREAKTVLPGVRTVDLAVKHVISVLDELRHIRTPPAVPEVYVISKERLKLSYGWKPAAWAKGLCKSPHCPTCGERAVAGDGLATWAMLVRKRYRCAACGGALWQADPTVRRMAPAEYMKSRLKDFFDVVVIDEIQDFKAGDSLQGMAMGSVLTLAPRALCLTGTLNGGYADDLFYLLYRMAPAQVKAEGFTYGGHLKWLEHYGVVQTVKDLDDGDEYQFGRGRKKKAVVRRRPGVAPVVIARHLLDKTAFIRLADVIDGLPPYEEHVVTVAVDGETQEPAYRKLEDDLRQAIRKHKRRALGAMLQALLSYPDSCISSGENIKIRGPLGDVVGTVTAPRVRLPPGQVLPKEQELLDWVARERSEGRKVLIYAVFTDRRDIRPRLQTILEAAGHRVVVLDAKVEPKRREAWVAARQDALDVLLVNPELVKTGLDFYAFPTVVFYQVGYNVFTLRQAARRSWRIGQTRPVRVVFFCYARTMQEIALSLIARKLETALLVEGDLPEGLAEYGQSEGSLIEELGKALTEGRAITGAEAAWAQFRQKELQTQLGLTAEATRHETTGPAATTVQPAGPVMLKVTLLEGRGRRVRRSVLEVSAADLDRLPDGAVAQVALF